MVMRFKGFCIIQSTEGVKSTTHPPTHMIVFEIDLERTQYLTLDIGQPVV